MAKTLLEWENKLIDVFELKDVEAIDEWDQDKQKMVHRICFNRNLTELKYVKSYTFDYINSEFRDNRFEELKIRLDGMEHVTII